MKSALGFTLVELIAVLALVGVLSTVAFTRFNAGYESQVQQSRDQLVAALFFAQQLAMDRSGNVQLVTSSNQFTVTLDGVDARSGGYAFPVNLPAGISLTPASFSYNRLGETSAAALVLSHSDGATVTVNVSASGYAN
ncbi:type II secretion system protein [Simiduia agarivorans]|uniref:Msha pilin protein mshc n=1 Tax=Simiduia agarivorans (strain DSM 21679 / JCM 13881 / BCRC 17597 / SA1) TaxID=1117647 RepID=K4KGE2_SIMAS|nr:type II secretion system protein [Simiduia agarivorans]AFU98051.1 msha pilin protein mshc [Simiduia agarivorans SA1 = DSM 21679]